MLSHEATASADCHGTRNRRASQIEGGEIRLNRVIDEAVSEGEALVSATRARRGRASSFECSDDLVFRRRDMRGSLKHNDGNHPAAASDFAKCEKRTTAARRALLCYVLL